jgi:branched-subunit amino acid aminotransferase/4-amino-4-deoxychorismate lyase
MEFDGQPAPPDAVQALALTNFGHFTSMRVEDRRVRGLSLHLARLVRDCRTLFATDLDPEHVQRLVADAIRDRSGPFIVRITVFDPELTLNHPGASATPRIGITFRPAAPATLPPMRVAGRRHLRDLPGVKHVGLFGALHERRAAQLDGYDDALLIHDGNVLEGPTWNIGFYDGDTAVWPKADVLPGVTMALLQQSHAHDTARVSVDELGRFQAAFATNASIGVRTISAIDTLELTPDHPIVDSLRVAYAAIQPEPLQ